MKLKVILATVLLAGSVNVSQADELQKFYENHSADMWSVFGMAQPGTDVDNYPRCKMATRWSDSGAYLSIDRDLNDGENLMWFYHPHMYFDERNKEQTMMFTFYGRTLPKTGINVPGHMVVVDKNRIVLRNIGDESYKVIGEASRMVMNFAGTNAPFEVNLRGTARAIGLMNECIKLYRTIKEQFRPNVPVPEIEPHQPAPSTTRSKTNA